MRQRCIPAGDAAMRRSELNRSGAPGPALRYFNQQMLIHELIRGSLVKIKGQRQSRQYFAILFNFKSKPIPSRYLDSRTFAGTHTLSVRSPESVCPRGIGVSETKAIIEVGRFPALSPIPQRSVQTIPEQPGYPDTPSDDRHAISHTSCWFDGCDFGQSILSNKPRHHVDSGYGDGFRDT
jgi:hypothetical protein